MHISLMKEEEHKEFTWYVRIIRSIALIVLKPDVHVFCMANDYRVSGC